MVGGTGAVGPTLGGADELTLGVVGGGTLPWDGPAWFPVLRSGQGITTGPGCGTQESCCSISLRPVSVCG